MFDLFWGISLSLASVFNVGTLSDPCNAILREAMRQTVAYQQLQATDWVTYYKNNWKSYYPTPTTGSSRVQFAPVFVSPQMDWSVPHMLISPYPPAYPYAPGYPPP